MNALSSPSVLHPELASFAQQIASIREDAAQLTRSLSATQMNWRSQPGRWSIAQCLAHITLGNQEYLREIDAAIAQARSRQLFSAGPFKHGWFGNWFARSFEPPPKFKLRNPKVIAPPQDIAGEKVSAEFDTSQQEVLQRVYEANGVDLGRAKITSPFLRLLRLSLGQRSQCLPHMRDVTYGRRGRCAKIPRSLSSDSWPTFSFSAQREP